MRTAIDLDVTVCASISCWTGASVGTLSSVEAGTPVATRAMVGAVVEVLVAEKASPSLVTEAVPRLPAAAVEAPGVPLAFVAESALPTAVTPAIGQTDVK